MNQKSADQVIANYTEEISSSEIVTEPLVSVCFITYNHAEFVEEALDSILMQETDFPFEIVIGEDASTDETLEIVRRYQQKYPEKIKILRSTENLGQLTGKSFQLNLIRNLRACRGKYIALLEGDDYWTEPLKLQKQVDFLNANSQYSMCFHAVSQIRGGLTERTFPSLQLKDRYSTEDLFTQWFIPTCSMVYRNVIEIPPWFVDCISGDIPLHFLIAEKGDIFFMKENMGAYRIHAGGLSNTHAGYYKAIGMMRIYNYLDIRYEGKYRELVDHAIEYEVDTHIVQPALKSAQSAFENAQSAFENAQPRFEKISGKRMIKELIRRFLQRLGLSI